jgi:hypothetical protein
VFRNLDALEGVSKLLQSAKADVAGPFRGPLVALAAGHAFSLVYDFILRGEWKFHHPGDFCQEPVIRAGLMVPLLALGVMLSGAATHFGGRGSAADVAWILVLFVMKVGFDALLRHRERMTGGFALRWNRARTP